MATISQLVFPDYLRNVEYKTACITFYAGTSTKSPTTDPNFGADDALIVKMGELSNGQNLFDPDIKVASSITLPYPNALADNQSHSWNTLSTLTGELAQSLESNTVGIRSSKDYDGKSKYGTLEKLSQTQVSKGISRIAQALGVRKPLADPGLFQTYNGSTPRVFNMSYQFVPLNQGEAQTIKDIIMWFKAYSSPGFVQNVPIMMSPYIFSIDFSGNQYISEMFNMKECVLTNMSVDYGADGAFSLFADGFPKQINMSLSFAEARVTYGEEYQGQQLKVGS